MYRLATCKHVLVIALVALGCAAPGTAGGAGGRPDWVSGPSSVYGKDLYVSAAGNGTSREAARDSARAELSRVFRSQIDSEFLSETTGTTIEFEGRSSSKVIEQLQIKTRVSTKGDFQNVRIVEEWHDRKTKTHHALAAVEKEKMRLQLLGELETAAEGVYGGLTRSDRAATHLDLGKALLDAAIASKQLDVIVAEARVVGRPSVSGLPSTGEIERDLDETIANTRFELSVVEIDQASGMEKGRVPKLQQALEKMITGLGFKVVRPGGGGNVWLGCRMSLEEIPRGLSVHFVRWEGACELSGPPPNGPVILSTQGSGGESFSTAALARTRAELKGSAKLSRELEQQIKRYLESDSGH